MNKLVIEPGRAEKNYYGDLWRYRELFYFLAWRDILVRYKQTAIGIAWAVIRPLLTALIFSFVFGKIAGLQSPGNVPYTLFVFAAMLPWQFFSTSLTECSNSLIGNSNLISKVYFPRLVIPASSVITSFVDFLITLLIMVAMMAWYHFCPDWRLLCLPLFIVLAAGASLGIGLWLCALTVEYRDFRYITPFIVQIGLYLSPVGFSSTTASARGAQLWAPLSYLFPLNPMVGIIDGFRWALLRGQSPLSFSSLLISIVLTVALCASGIWYFRKMEKTFADVI